MLWAVRRFCGLVAGRAWQELHLVGERARCRRAVRAACDLLQPPGAPCWTYIRFYIIMPGKLLAWVGAAKAALRAFPADARREAGHDLWLIQAGRPPRDWRPMPELGAGAVELRIHSGTEHRVFYVAKFDEAVYVLHAFEKRSRKTSQQDIAIGRQRYRDVLATRAAKTH